MKKCPDITSVLQVEIMAGNIFTKHAQDEIHSKKGDRSAEDYIMNCNPYVRNYLLQKGYSDAIRPFLDESFKNLMGRPC